MFYLFTYLFGCFGLPRCDGAERSCHCWVACAGVPCEGADDILDVFVASWGKFWSGVLILDQNLGAVLDGLCFDWSVLGLVWFWVFVYMECLRNETWDVRVECAVIIVRLDFDAYIQTSFPVDCNIVPFF